MRKKSILLLIIIAAFGYTSLAQQPAVITNNKKGWHKIAETAVDLRGDRDEVLVIGADHFKSLRLKVIDEPVEIMDLTVVYENDQRQEIPVRRLIKPGGKTRVIDLSGKNRAIKKILLMYKTVPNPGRDRAHVEIFGRK